MNQSGDNDVHFDLNSRDVPVSNVTRSLQTRNHLSELSSPRSAFTSQSSLTSVTTLNQDSDLSPDRNNIFLSASSFTSLITSKMLSTSSVAGRYPPSPYLSSPSGHPGSQRPSPPGAGYWSSPVSDTLSYGAPGYHHPTAAVPNQGYPSPFAPWHQGRGTLDGPVMSAGGLGEYERGPAGLSASFPGYMASELRGWAGSYPGAQSAAAAALSGSFGSGVAQGFQYSTTGMFFVVFITSMTSRIQVW